MKRYNMDTMQAPFNFVPVGDKVFFPDWADQISHDIPFREGESGVIKYKLIAESPIFIKDGNTINGQFCNIGGNIFIGIGV